MATSIQTASSARHVVPEFYVVNYAHNGLNQRAKEAQFRIVGAFSTQKGAQGFSDRFSSVHGMDCFCVGRGQPNMIPKDYWFVDDPTGAQTKLQGMIDESIRKRQMERDEFQANRARKRQYAKDDGEFDAELERSELEKLIQNREDDKEKASAYMESEMFSLTDPVDTRLRGAFGFAAVSTIPDTTTEELSEQEHGFIIHNVFKTVDEATNYIKKELEAKVQDRDIFVVDMYEWMQPSFSFSDFVMDHVPTEYRDKMQNEIMQFKMSGARQKRESLEAQFNAKMPTTEITDGDPIEKEKEEPAKEDSLEESDEMMKVD